MKKRSSYRPRGVNPQAWKVGIQGALKLSTEDQLKTLARVAGAVDDLTACRPSKEAWSAVFDCINLLEAFTVNGLIKSGGMELVDSLQDTVLAAVDRQSKQGSNVLRPSEVLALQEMVGAYGQVLSICSHRELFAAMERVERKVSQALRRGSHGSVTVLEAR